LLKIDHSKVTVKGHIGLTGPDLVCATDEVVELRSVERVLVEEGDRQNEE
jgi:hypothetical protein